MVCRLRTGLGVLFRARWDHTVTRIATLFEMVYGLVSGCSYRILSGVRLFEIPIRHPYLVHDPPWRQPFVLASIFVSRSLIEFSNIFSE